MYTTIEYEQGNPRRDPEILSRLLGFAWRDRAEGGDGLSVCPTFPSHLRTFRAAAREIISIPVAQNGGVENEYIKTTPEWLNLFTVMFHCYFQYMRADRTQNTSPDPLIDALLLFCDCTDLRALSRTPGYRLMLSFIARCVGEGLSSPGSSENLTPLLARLKTFWNGEKRWRLGLDTESLMPWSMNSIKEGSLSPPIPATDQPCIHPGLVLHTHQSEKLLTFPDMLWLGASHDGYPRYSSIVSYVSARWCPSFTAYDNVALWQAAMTFGVLEAIIDLNIPEALLLEKQPDGTVVFTCRNIGVLVYHWIVRVICENDEGRRKQFWQTLLRAENALSTECTTTGRGIFTGLSRLSQNDVDDIICAVYLLLSAFTLPMSQLYIHDVSNISLNGRHRAVDIFLQRMVADGWCPSFRYSDRLKNPQYWWYASSFNPFIRHHQREHSNCFEDGCHAHSIDESTYKTLHATPECSCLLLSPSIDSLRKILQCGRIPVISYTDGALEVHPASGMLPYVAISHVWVDGLGSSSEKGLPTCQIERIHGYVHELLGPTRTPAFWIDGLCIPEEEGLRKKAIVMMRQTYQDAAKVLVFDSSICTLCSSATSVEENVFRIGASMWMQRVWTLQEALLARELYFEFSTGIASADNLIRTLDQRLGMDYGIGLVTAALVIGSSTPTPSVLRSGKRPNFIEIMKLLFRRSTSNPRDEPLAIAGLLNIDPAKILSQPDLESRIRTLFLEVGTLPRHLIFGEYERMKMPGFRWCPTTLTSIGAMAWDSPEVVCTRDGLTTKTKVLVLCLPRIDVLEGMNTDVYVHVASVGGYYSLQKLLNSLPKERPCSINALLPDIDELSSQSMGTMAPAVAVNIPGVQDPQDVQLTEFSTIRCEYVMRSWLSGRGDTWDPMMEGHPMLEGRPVRVRVTVT